MIVWQMNKVILILDKFFWKYEGGSNWHPSPHPPEKATFKKASLIRINMPIEQLRAWELILFIILGLYFTYMSNPTHWVWDSGNFVSSHAKKYQNYAFNSWGSNLSPDKYLKLAPQQNLAALSLVTFSIVLLSC